MRLVQVVLATLALAVAAPAAASAATATHGYVTANVHFRAGPDTSFPSWTVIPYGAPVVIYGCLSDRSWCDVSWAGERGWVHAAYLGYGYQPSPYPVPYPEPYPSPVYAAPVITFEIGSYWNDHYRGRPWYKDRDRYDGRRWHRDNDDWNRDKRNNDWNPIWSDNRRDNRRNWDDNRNRQQDVGNWRRNNDPCWVPPGQHNDCGGRD